MTAILITTKRFSDNRGWFSETWNKNRFQQIGVAADFVQDNQSCSLTAGTIRGLHFQRPPHAQAKLVRCIRGKIFDVVVDLRTDSPTFGKWEGVELSAVQGNQLYVPAGYAHGFLTLEPDCEVAYKVDAFYAPEADGGILWNDPDFSIEWPLGELQPILSDKDTALPTLKKAEFAFQYDGQPLLPLKGSK